MSLKLKILGMGLLAVLATSAFAAINASAIVNGHFTAEPKEDHLIITGAETNPGKHFLVFHETKNATEYGSTIECTHVKYHGTLSGALATTTQSVEVRPEYIECATNGGVWGEVKVDVPTECGTNVFKLTSRTPPNHGTVHVECVIKITHPNCEITIPKQTPTGGIVYDTDPETTPHAITATVTATGIVGQFHGGICVFLGTTHTFDMTGSTTFWGEDTAGNKVPITAT